MPDQRKTVAVPSPVSSESIADFFYMVGIALVALFAGARGWRRTPPEPEKPVLAVSGALITDAAVDPLLAEMKRQIAVTERLCALMEQEVGLRSYAVEESRKREDQKAMALAIADQVREDILEELRREIHANDPAPMPPTRKRT